MKDFTCGLDIREIPLSEFPDPSGYYSCYKWSMNVHELVLSVPDEECFYVKYDVPGGYICSHAEKEIVTFFVDSIREVCQRVSGQAASVSEAEKEERVLSLGDSLKEVLGPIPEKTFSHRDIPPNRVHAMLTYGDEDES